MITAHSVKPLKAWIAVTGSNSENFRNEGRV